MGYFITKTVFGYLANHMMEVYNQKIDIANAFSQDYDAYIEVLNFLNGYIKSLDGCLDNATVEKGENKLPFVILGSVAYLKSADGAKRKAYRVVLPHKKYYAFNESEAIDICSCLSPIGQALLFKQAGEEFTLKTERKTAQYIVEGIGCDFNI